MIKGFLRTEKVKPIASIQIGANVPVGCKDFGLYAESPDSSKCVSDAGAKCQYYPSCKMAGMNDAALVKASIKTRPCQLGFFLIPKVLRDFLGLPPRPVDIPGILLTSHKMEPITNEAGQIIGINEPEDVIGEYPVFDYNLIWWSKTQLICTGNGEIAHWYPADRAHEKHNQERECLFEGCPDFKSGDCKARGDLYFRIPNAPGFPALYHFGTGSGKAIQGILNELREIYNALGHVSLIPLILSLEAEKAAPTVNQQGGGRGKISTTVYRVHIRTAFSMQNALAAKNETMNYLNAGPAPDMKMLKAATPDKPDYQPPVECLATADKGDWVDPAPAPAPTDNATPPAAVQPEPQQEKAKRGPKPKAATPPAQQPAPAPAKQAAPTPGAPPQQTSAQLEAKFTAHFRFCATVEKFGKLVEAMKAEVEKGILEQDALIRIRTIAVVKKSQIELAQTDQDVNDNLTWICEWAAGELKAGQSVADCSQAIQSFTKGNVNLEYATAADLANIKQEISICL